MLAVNGVDEPDVVEDEGAIIGVYLQSKRLRNMSEDGVQLADGRLWRCSID